MGASIHAGLRLSEISKRVLTFWTLFFVSILSTSERLSLSEAGESLLLAYADLVP